MIHDGILYVDNSTLTAEQACNFQSWLRYHQGYTALDEHAYLIAGTAGHEAMAAYFRGASPEGALKTFAHHYEQWAADHLPPGHRLTFENTARILGQWFDTHPLVGLPFVIDPGLVEIGFARPLTDDIVIVGRMDAIGREKQTRGIYVIDNKFPGSFDADDARMWKMNSQVSTYVWAAEAHIEEPILGMILNVVPFSKLPDSTKRCPRHATIYAECGHLHHASSLVLATRSPDQIEEWKKVAINLAKRFRDRITRYPTLASLSKIRLTGMMGYKTCVTCGFFDFCTTGRKPESMATMLLHHPWEPYDVTRTERVGSHHTP